MPRMPDIFHEAKEAVFGRRHVVPLSEGGTDEPSDIVAELDRSTALKQWEHALAHPRHRAADAAPETPAPAPVTLAVTPVAAATQQEEPMSVLDDFIDDIKTIGEDGIAEYKAIKANPETAAVLSTLVKLAPVVGIPAGFITRAGDALAVVGEAYAPDPAATGTDPAQAAPAPQPAPAPAAQ